MRVLGIDEVGRGCIAGPLVVGAVLLDCNIIGLKDSKQLSKKKREYLSKEIYCKALYVGLGWASSGEIDEIGLSSALKLAAERSLVSLVAKTDKRIIDGNYNYLPTSFNFETLVGGDNIVPAISAASIVAKVARDNFMVKLHDKFPYYGFNTNVGYCTKMHAIALEQYGINSYHRKTFEPVKSILRGNNLINS